MKSTTPVQGHFTLRRQTGIDRRAGENRTGSGRRVPLMERTGRCQGADQGVLTDLGPVLGQREMAPTPVRCSSPGYHCNGKTLVEERRSGCLYVGAMQIDRAHDGPRKVASPRPRLVCSRTGIEPANDDTDTAATISIDGCSTYPSRACAGCSISARSAPGCAKRWTSTRWRPAAKRRCRWSTSSSGWQSGDGTCAAASADSCW